MDDTGIINQNMNRTECLYCLIDNPASIVLWEMGR